MLKNLNQLGGLHFSQGVLLALTQKGTTREEAYQIVQDISMKAWNKKGDFKKLLLKDQKVLKILTKKEIEMIFDLDKHTKNITYIYNRVFK